MIKKFKIFEEISWWKNGELSEDDDSVDLTEFEVGDRVRRNGSVYHWANHIIKMPKNNSGYWYKHLENDFCVIDDVRYCDNVSGYTGQIIKLKDKWPWFQTTNIVKIISEGNKYTENVNMTLKNTKKLKEYEGISWWKDGELGDEEEDDNSIEFKVGDIVSGSGTYYWKSVSLDLDGCWVKSHGKDGGEIVEVWDSSSFKFRHYTGQIIKLKLMWPLFQTTNFEKIK